MCDTRVAAYSIGYLLTSKGCVEEGENNYGEVDLEIYVPCHWLYQQYFIVCWLSTFDDNVYMRA